MSRVLVTGNAGFIGYHTALRLLDLGHEVVGVDVVNDYYDVRLKEARLARLAGRPGYRFQRLDLADRVATAAVFEAVNPDRVVHLAAQAGVRYSLTAPQAYVDSNLVAFANVLEGCRGRVAHLIYASSSSVYGNETAMPFSEASPAAHPISLYAATKKANELMAHSYSALFGLPTTALRFFTVYGPWGRPDMALFSFTRAILEDRPIAIYNHGDMARDFTYVDDIVDGMLGLLDHIPQPDPAWDAENADPGTSSAPYRVYNLGRGQPVRLLDFIAVLEEALGRSARKEWLPIQPGDIPSLAADVSRLAADAGYAPQISVDVGVRRFVAWYRDFYGV